MAISIELDSEAEQRLQKLVALTGKPIKQILQELIARGLDDAEDLRLAEATMERVASGKEPIYSADQVRKNLGLDS